MSGKSGTIPIRDSCVKVEGFPKTHSENHLERATMPDIRLELEKRGLTLPKPPKPIASYVPVDAVYSGNLVFISGQLPLRDGQLIATGKAPKQVTLEQAQACSRQCVLNALAALLNAIGDLEKIRRVVKLDGFVACDPDFTEHPQVINGASDLLVELMGEHGRHTRAAVGVASLPMNAPVEIAFTFLVD